MSFQSNQTGGGRRSTIIPNYIHNTLIVHKNKNKLSFYHVLFRFIDAAMASVLTPITVFIHQDVFLSRTNILAVG